MAQLETLNNGKPLSDSYGDIDASVDCLRYYAGWTDKIHGSVIPIGNTTITTNNLLQHQAA